MFIFISLLFTFNLFISAPSFTCLSSRLNVLWKLKHLIGINTIGGDKWSSLMFASKKPHAKLSPERTSRYNRPICQINISFEGKLRVMDWKLFKALRNFYGKSFSTRATGRNKKIEPQRENSILILRLREKFSLITLETFSCYVLC